MEVAENGLQGSVSVSVGAESDLPTIAAAGESINLLFTWST